MNQEKVNFQKLAPINQVDLNIYKDALEYVFENKDITNVGVTGPYSAGKSSVIETFKVSNPNIKFMHISLAYFQSASITLEEATNQNTLEGKILNQLIHQIDSDKIPQTNFRVKKRFPDDTIMHFTSMIYISILVLIYIFNNERWSRFVSTITYTPLQELLKCTTYPISTLVIGVIFAIVLFLLIYNIVRLQINRNLFKGITIQGNSIEIFEQSDESYFDKHLNEVLYLFENANVDVIVFEDLDRYDTNQIFQRLREINTLINSRNKEKDKILRFFYLLRDDIFVSKERTKFFEFIMPIVPVLDGSNSFNQFIEHFKESGILELFDKQFLQEISLYIDDMRILKNIHNEFIIYYKRISTTEQNPNKLLAMIIYKNIYPRDFSELQLNKGYVYTLFNSKDKFIEDEISSINEQISTIHNKIESSEKEQLNNEAEIDIVYDQKQRTQGRFHNEFTTERIQRKENIKSKSEYEREKLKSEISDLETKSTSLRGRKLSELINKNNVTSIFQVIYTNETGETKRFNEIKTSDYFSLIKYLIRNGYIDETYQDYMTYFYENSISRIDKIFLRSVTDQLAKEYTYHLKNPKMVIERLDIVDFDKEEVLNIDLLDELVEFNKDYNNVKMTKILNQIKESSNFTFISIYLELGKHVDAFIPKLNNIWPNVFNGIINQSDFTSGQKKKYVLKTLYHTSSTYLVDMNSEYILSEYINNTKDFLEIHNPNIKSIVDTFGVLDIKFQDIDYEKSNKELFEVIYFNNFYAISFKLICLMLKCIYKYFNQEDLIHKNHTIIYSKPNEPLAVYITNNISEYITVFIENCEGEITDSKESIVQILNNENVEIVLKHQYINVLKTKLNSLEEINDFSLWEKLIELKLIIYSEENVMRYFCRSGKGLDEYIEKFINTESTSFEYSCHKINEDFSEEEKMKFFIAVVKSRGLNINVYEAILKSLKFKIVHFNIEGIPGDNIEVLINHKIIHMKSEELLFMRQNYPDKVIQFIKHNIKTYIEEVIDEEKLNTNEILVLIKQDIEDEYKIQLLNLTDEKISVMCNDYSEEIKIHILKHNFEVEDIDKLLEEYIELTNELKIQVENILIKYLHYIIESDIFVPNQLLNKLFSRNDIEKKYKLQLFAFVINKLGKEECRGCLQILGLSEYLNMFEGKRPTVPATEVHKQILEGFKSKGWIIGYDVDRKHEGLFRVRTKKVKK